MKSYKLQKLDDDTLIINWKSTGNYMICICTAIFFLGLGIYTVCMVDYDGYDDNSWIIFFLLIFSIIPSMISILLSIVIPVKQQLILNKNEGTIYFRPYNIYGKIIKISIYPCKESFFLYSSVKNIRSFYSRGFGIIRHFIDIILETSNPISHSGFGSLPPSKCSFCEVIAQKISLISSICHKIFPKHIYIDTHDDKEAEEIIFIIQDFFKNYDNSSFSQG